MSRLEEIEKERMSLFAKEAAVEMRLQACKFERREQQKVLENLRREAWIAEKEHMRRSAEMTLKEQQRVAYEAA